MNETIRLMVVFYGLVMFVPYGKGLTVLFVSGGDHKHAPIVHVVKHGGKLMELPLLEKEANLTLAGGPEDGEVDLSALGEFAQLENLFTFSTRGMVKKDCVHNTPDCRRGEHDLVLWKIHLTGDWSTRPATFCNGGWSPPIEFDDSTRFQFKRDMRGIKRDLRTRRLATALRLDIDLPSKQLDGILGQLIGTELRIQNPGNNTCKHWLGEEVHDCRILLIGNTPPEVEVPPPFDPLDRHFAAFYRLSTNPPWQINQLLPYIYTDLPLDR